MDTIEFTKSLNAWKTNEFSIDVNTYEPKFNFISSNKSTSRIFLPQIESCNIVPGKSINFDLANNKNDDKKLPPNCTEQICSNDWLDKYGLDTNKLKLDQILNQIGFKQAENYINNLNKTISSKYSAGLYLQTASTSGIIYNITCSQSKLLDYIMRLEEAINLYRKRLQWLNSDSRRVFGLFSDLNIVLVLDSRQTEPSDFEQFKTCLIQLLREQISRLSKFNLIRYTSDIECFRDQIVIVSPETIDEAVDWTKNWSLPNPLSSTITCEACLRGFTEANINAVHLISDNLASNSSRELLNDKIIKESKVRGIKLNISSYNCVESSTVEFLRRLADGSGGSFHAYCLLRATNDYLPGGINRDPTKNQVVANKRLFGGAPQGAGVKKDLMTIFDELLTANEIVEHLKTLLSFMGNQRKSNSSSAIQSISELKLNVPENKENEEYLSSKNWLKIYGLNTKKLELFDVLADSAFKHCDGVVEIKEAPVSGVGDAIPRQKLINAKYCDQFAHVLWNDGTIRHVHVTPEMHRLYERKMRNALDLFEKRIEWLSKGSRELFGTVIEGSICILIDISHSMQHSLDFVKQKLLVLLQEQLKSKQKFNIIAFNDKILPWRDRMVEVSEHNFNDAWKFIKNLSASGTTNTLGAIKFALADLATEAIYLLTDGRPNQMPRQILSQVTLNNKCPIHVISFNCNDQEANRFLALLAKETNGRYHYYNDSSSWNADPDGPVPYESEDIRLLKEELFKGVKYLKQIENLRDECSKLSYLERKQLLNPKCSKDHNKVVIPSKITQKSSEEIEIVENFNKVFKAKSFRESISEQKLSEFKNKSILDSLNGAKEWVPSETREVLDRQHKRQEVIKQKTPKRVFSAIKKPKELTVKQWIKANSLSALKLTILDILGPTLVKQKPKYIEIKGETKRITSKVWQDISTYTVFTNETNELRIVNAQSVNLEEFEAKLRKQINIYQQYLSEKLQNLANNQKVTFDEENYYICYKLVEENKHWSIDLQDLNAFKREIELAYKYIQQSEDIRNSTKQKEKIIQKEIQVSSNREPENLTNSKMTLPKNVGNLEGEKVLARHDMHGYYYEAVVLSQSDPRHVTIKFSNGVIQDNLPVLFIIRHTKVTSRPSLDMGDYVMAHVKNEFQYDCYVPGIVQSIDPTTNPKQHRIMYFNGNEGMHLRHELISINKNRYGLTSNYIRNKLGMSNKLTPLNNIPLESPKTVKNNDIPNNTPRMDMDSLKNDIIESIMDHFNKLNLDEKYKQMHQELLEAKETQKRYKSEFKKQIKTLKNELKSKQTSDKDQQISLLPDKQIVPVSTLNKEANTIELKPPSKSTSKVNHHRKASTINDELHKMRDNLCELTIGEEVLAKWNDDGWYYKSIVKSKSGSHKYIIEDINRTQETVLREDIISENDVSNSQLCLHDPVIALHSAYSFSYAPGLIIRISNDLTLLIRFYDGVESIVNKEEVYKIPLFKFEFDVEQIVQYEKRWIGETVVARHSFNHVYELGKIKERIGNGRQYAIQWSDNRVSVETATHIFGRYTHQPSIGVNEYVIASQNGNYLPGKIIGTKGENYIVRFVDGNTNDHVKKSECYWISRQYYEDAYDFIRRKSKIIIGH